MGQSDTSLRTLNGTSYCNIPILSDSECCYCSTGYSTDIFVGVAFTAL